MKIETFLRSINLVYDASEIDRISHYIPTSKSVPLLRSLYGEADDRAFFIIAPYGSGKSLTAAYLLHVVENTSSSQHGLEKLGGRVNDVSPEVGAVFSQRVADPDATGLGIALHGYVEDIVLTIQRSIVASLNRIGLKPQAKAIERSTFSGGSALTDLLIETKAKVRKSKKVNCDRICILWDEFGRHLENLVSSGRTSELLDIQLLAEFATRSKDLPMTMGLFLHQGLLQYAGNMPNTARAEWKKIEGRFESIQYVDDSKEIYRLIGEACGNKTTKTITKAEAKGKAKQLKGWSLFHEFTQKELSELLFATPSISAFALYLLPRISARIAQNERTLFTFLNSLEKSVCIDCADLYDFFSPSMRADTGIGGTNKQWVETQSALSKVVGDLDAEKTIKTTAVLGLGVGGERHRVTKSHLVEALSTTKTNESWETIVDRLIANNLLLYRKHSDDISVWHGTDLDLRIRLSEYVDRQRDTFDLVAFLTEHFPAPIWKPVRYNAEKSIDRYFDGQYINVNALKSKLDQGFKACDSWDVDRDGRIFYVLAESDEHCKIAHREAAKVNDSQIVLVVPSKPVAITDAALETYCLQQMRVDPDLIGSDPLAQAEIEQLIDDSYQYLANLVDQLILPNEEASWYSSGKTLAVNSSRAVRDLLSELMSKVYPSTPRFNNEMLNRKRPTPVIVNARKKLMLAILERMGKPEFEIEGNFPDKSIFRTLLLNTGLYRKDKNTNLWRFGNVDELSDESLKKVWELMRQFFAVASEHPKDFSKDLFEKLQASPIGLSAGVIPVLLTCGFKAFGNSISLTCKGEYVPDILPSIIEDICKNPDSYSLRVYSLSENEEEFLRNIYSTFISEDASHAVQSDLIRLCYDVIIFWLEQLPQIAKNTSNISDKAKRFRRVLLKRDFDPVRFFIERLPKLLDVSIDAPVQLTKELDFVRYEIANVLPSVAEETGAMMVKAIGAEAGAAAWMAVEEWAVAFDTEFVKSLPNKRAQAMLIRIKMRYRDDVKLVNSVAEALIEKPVSYWEDSTKDSFERAFKDVVQEIEELALKSGAKTNTQVADGMSKVVKRRIDVLAKQLIELTGEAKTADYFKALVKKLPNQIEKD